jgi:hypothetical protein
METIIKKLHCSRTGNGSKRITAVAAYEDARTDARVNEFFGNLARYFGRDCEVTRQMWLLNELRMPQLRAIAANEAAGADLVIISIHHTEALPVELINWFESWIVRKRKHPRALLALFDPAYQGDSGSLRVYLKQVAKQGSMDLLISSDEPPKED